MNNTVTPRDPKSSYSHENVMPFPGRHWKSGEISYQGTKFCHAKCRTCGGPIWFGKVQLKENSFWCSYSVNGNGGNGAAVMVKHDCHNRFHKGDQTPTAPGK